MRRDCGQGQRVGLLFVAGPLAVTEEAGQGNRQAREQRRNERIAAAQHAPLYVLAIAQFQWQHCVIERVKDPVFGNAGFGIKLPFAYQVAVKVRGKNFNHDVRRTFGVTSHKHIGVFAQDYGDIRHEDPPGLAGQNDD